jgi:hypothetical protein
VVAAKAQAFAKDPDFRQEVSDLATSEGPDTVTVRFTKAWRAHGVTRRVTGSVGISRVGERLLVVAETDAATTEAQSKAGWSCGKCTKTEKTGPDRLASHDVNPEHFGWTLEVTKASGSGKVALSDGRHAVDLSGVTGWSCTVGATQGRLSKGPMAESSTFYLEDRQLYCSRKDGGAKLISHLGCSGRGPETDSDYIELSLGSRVRLACAIL